MTPNDLFNTIISLSLPIAVGYALVRLLCRNVSLEPLPTLAIAYGLGMGILSQTMLLLGVLDIPYSRVTIGSFLLLTFLVLMVACHRKQGDSSHSSKTKQPAPLSVWDALSHPAVSLTRRQKIFCLLGLLYVFYNVLFVFWRTLNIPIEGWDSIATIAFKAKIFFFDRSLRGLALPHISYPTHVSFLQAWIALNLGRWDDILVNMTLPFTFLAYLIPHFYFLKSRTNAAWAVGGLCLLLSSNFFVYHATIPYADFSLMYYNCTAILLLLLWAGQRHAAVLILAALFSGFTTFVKLEGTIYLGLHTALFILLLLGGKGFSLKEKWINFLTFLIPSYGIAGLFHIYKIAVKTTGMEGRLNLSFSPDQAHRLQIIMENMQGTFFLSGNWNILWLLLMVGIFLNWSNIKQQREIRLLGITLGMFLAVYIAFFTFTRIYIDYYNTYNALSRVILHFFPLVTWLIILLYYPQGRAEK